MNLFHLGWRNLWRRRRRTLITLTSIGFGVFLAVTFTGTGDYFYTKMIDTSATMGMGHVSIQAAGYNASPTLDKRLAGATQLREQVMQLPEVRDARQRIVGQAMFSSASKTVGGAFIAVEPANENAEFNLFLKAMVEGDMPQNNNSRGIVIGVEMADKLGLKIGRKIVYTTTDVHGEIVSEIARVRGLFETGVREVDSGMVMLPIDRVRNMLGYADDEATLVAIVLDDQRHARKVRDLLQQQYGQEDREFLSWHESQQEVSGLIAMDKSTNYLSQVLIGLLIGAGIFNTMLMSVLERKREFGIMMAVGMAPLSLFLLVIIESFWVALLGLITGSILTAPWFAFLYYKGLDISGMMGDDYTAGGVLIEPILKIALFGESAMAIVSAIFILALLSGLYPAWRAARVPPVETLRAL